MVTITHERTWERDEAAGLDNITDMEIALIGGETYLYTLDASDGTVTSFDVTGGQEAVTLNRRTAEDGSAGHAQSLAIVENDGECLLVTAGPTAGEMRAYEISTGSGKLRTESEAPFAPGEDLGGVSAVGVYERSGTQYIAAATAEGELTGLSDRSAGLTPTSTVSGDDLYLEDVTAVEFVRGPFGHYVFAASGSEAGITVTRSGGPGRLNEYDLLDADDGLWVSAISDLATVDSLGQDYLLVADQGTGSVHSVRIDADGTLTVVDAIYDDLQTRYAGVSTIEAFSVKHRDFAAVGGSDGGFTILEVLNDGTLRETATLIDDGTASLTSITDIEVAVEGEAVTLFVSSSGDGGFSQFDLDFGNMGTHRAGKGPGERTGGSNRDDLLTGSDGDDDLYGNRGDDVIWDGAGEDYMSGGAGADIFMLAFDGDDDLIVRFEPGVDRIDLSDWPMLYDISRLEIEPYHAGVRIYYFDEMVRITSEDRTTIDSLTEADFIFG